MTISHSPAQTRDKGNKCRGIPHSFPLSSRKENKNSLPDLKRRRVGRIPTHFYPLAPSDSDSAQGGRKRIHLVFYVTWSGRHLHTPWTPLSASSSLSGLRKGDSHPAWGHKAAAAAGLLTIDRSITHLKRILEKKNRGSNYVVVAFLQTKRARSGFEEAPIDRTQYKENDKKLYKKYGTRITDSPISSKKCNFC